MLSNEEAVTINQLIANLYMIQYAAATLRNNPKPTKDDFDMFLESLMRITPPANLPVTYTQYSNGTTVSTGTTTTIDMSRVRCLEVKY